MAEQVQAILDQMVAPLRDLVDRGIFSESEIRAIVARRRESEYLLRRRAARKADFLRYIEAEMLLEKLRAIRTRRVLVRQARASKHEESKQQQQQQQQGDSNKKKKTNLGDAHIVQHIHFLFVRALRKFRSDVSLCLQHAEFAKEAKSYTRLGRIYAEALQVHPRNVGLWIEAASHEFFGHMDESKGERVGGGSVQNARILLQRGLRINQKSQDLWLQYFALEFHHIQKIRGRREILQLGDGGVSEQDKQQQQDESSSSDPLFRDAPIPTVVYENAIKAIPDDVTFRLKFLDICGLFPQTDSVEALIIGSIERDFNDNPEAWIARAAYAVEQKHKRHQDAAGDEKEAGAPGFATEPSTNDEEDTDDHLQPRKKQKQDGTGGPKRARDEVISVLEEATNQISTSEMYLQSIQFVRAYMQELADDHIIVEGEKEDVFRTIEETKGFVEYLFKNASGMGLKSAGLVMEHADYLAGHGNTEDAVKLLEHFLMDSTRCTTDTSVWMLWARLAEQLDPPCPAEQIFRMALNRIPMHDKGHMVILLELFDVLLRPSSLPKTDAEQQRRNDELSDLFQRVLMLSPGDEYQIAREVDGSDLQVKSVAVTCLQYLQYSFEVGGIAAARRVYKMLLQTNYANSSCGKTQHDLDAMKEFFDECIQLEKSKNGKKSKGKKQTWPNASSDTKSNLRRLYDAAACFFRDTDDDLSDMYQQRRVEDIHCS